MIQRVTDMARRAGGPVLLLILAICVLAGCALASNAETSSGALPQAAAAAAKLDTPAPVATAPTAGADRLYVAGANSVDEDGIFVLNATSGAIQSALPRGYISPDWSTLFEVAPARDTTTVRAYDLATGRMLRETTVAGLYDVPAPPENPRESAFSPDGQQLLLYGQPTPAEQQAWNTGKAPPTRILLLDTSFKSAPRHVDLGGYFWFDTLGSDSLYLIEVLDNSREYGPGHSPRYHVHRYDLATGRLDDYPIVDKREPGPMNGNRRSSIASADGVWLYSLYTRDAAGPFVHVLNVRDAIAFCVDLPFPAGDGDFESELMWSLALSPDQRTLYAVNGALGQVAAMDTEKLEVRRSAILPKPAAQTPSLLARLGRWLMPPAAEAKRMIASGAVVSPDEQTLFAVEDLGFAAISTGDLTLQGHYMTGWPLSSLAVSPDGATLYAASSERSALLRLGLPLPKDAPAPERIATSIRPETVMRVVPDR